MSKSQRTRTERLFNEKPTWPERLAALRYIPRLLKLVWRTHRGFTTTMVVLRLLRSFIPITTLWIAKLIIDAVIAARTAAPDFSRLWKLVALEIAIVLIGDALDRASALMESLLSDLFTNYTSVRLMQHAANLDLYQFEDPAFYDQLERARKSTSGRIGLLTTLITMSQDVLTLVALSIALFVYNPWLLLLLGIAVLPNFIGETHFASLEYSLLYRWTPKRRHLDYLRFLGASDRTAKEVHMFGLAPWLVERYRTLSERFYEENKSLSIRKSIVATALSAIGTLGYYGSYVIMLVHAVRGLITIGSLTFLAGSFSRSRDLIQRLFLSASKIYEQSLYLEDLFGFFEMKPTITSTSKASAVPKPIREGFIFDNVSFRYPGSDRWALRHVSFRLRPGERVAFVGENGAGKTTLTKLLARLYDPIQGRILLDGTDLRDYDLSSLRRAIAIIFQDFFRYDLRFDENIGIGQIDEVQTYLDLSEQEKIDDGTNGVIKGVAQIATPPPSLVTAAEKSLAASILPRLPKGYRQMLGHRFEGGVNLSGGEWQKIALARAYMRDAQVIILDEPTSALDARAEYEVFKRFSELIAGKIAVLISHRFSTVRMADHLIVLQDGTIVEEGTHNELVASNGLYSELFALQSEGYR